MFSVDSIVESWDGSLVLFDDIIINNRFIFKEGKFFYRFY